MTDSKRAYEKLLKGVQDFVLKVVDKTADKTYTGIIKQINLDGTYSVLLNNILYDNVPALAKNSGKLNDTVYILVPQGNMNNMFILNSGGTSINGSGGSVTAGVNSINGRSGDVILSSRDVGAINENNVEKENIDFTEYFE